MYGDGTMTDLQSRIDPALSWNLRSPTAINDSGSIVWAGNEPVGTDARLSHDADRPALCPTLASDRPTRTLRMMQGSTTASGKAGIGIDAPGNTPTNYTLSASALDVTSPVRHVAPAVVTAIPSSFSWADTTAVGCRTGSITLANVSDPNRCRNDTMSVSGAVLANRVLNVAAIGSSLTPVRIMAKARITTTISSGNDPLVDGDDVATPRQYGCQCQSQG